jgi:hypothetical protein
MMCLLACRIVCTAALTAPEVCKSAAEDHFAWYADQPLGDESFSATNWLLGHRHAEPRNWRKGNFRRRGIRGGFRNNERF